MSHEVRRTLGRSEINSIINVVNGTYLRSCGATKASAGIADGTTVGNLKTVTAVDYAIGGLTVAAQLAATDDFWDLSGETDTTSVEFRAYWLYQDGTFDAGTIGYTAADALAFIGVPDTAKSVIGVYVAGVSTDFGAALVAQGTVYNGVPDGAGGAIDWIESVSA